ncbi:carboxy terminal-processing peptidase [Novipirellula artificiosorum]|uniref:Tail-specific protease n=1 Tax=Novipirellula artificiosorum TaxID=2528016 RepID=A0A5C6DVT3_9BACT|nr:carboxy terminal-processing peptidase [Novipirellula artificiosorum]TWU40465.1 Tail-specific protease precursor [Novipirellula artificiosorum]
MDRLFSFFPKPLGLMTLCVASVLLCSPHSYGQAGTQVLEGQGIAPVVDTPLLADPKDPPPMNMAQPSARDSMVSRLIATLMPRNHISSQELNDEISQRALDLFVNSLDPMKLYFYQGDIDQFARNRDRIDDMIQDGDLSFGYEIFGRFIDRVDERVAVAQELLDGDFDFQREEQIIIDPEAAVYAKTPDESRDRWRRQIKYALLDQMDEGKEGEEARDLLRRRYDRYGRRWRQTDSDDLLEMYLSAVTTAYDPHSTYMSPGSLDDFQILMSLNLDGIGAQLREKDGNTVVTRVIPGGAAARHGELKTDDVIVSVGQDEEGDLVDIVEMPLKDVVALIRGKAGSVVRLGVKPGGAGEVEILRIERARIELEESAARGKVIEHAVGDGQTLKIGYINLPSFYLDMEAAQQNKRDFRSSTRDVQRILGDFKTQNVNGVVLDLSTNGGGSLTEAINLTGLFIDRGPVVQVKNANGTVQQYADEDSGTAWDGPLVVLTSKFSASASEIFAGAIKDYQRGIVVGDPATHGKGTVQTLMDLGQQLFRNRRENYGALKVTLQQFYLPDGESTQRTGVAADVILPSITSKMDIGEADLKYALPNDRVKPASHEMYHMVPADLLGKIRTDSIERVSKEKEFADLLHRVELYVRQKEKDSISLNETEFMARRKELDSQKEEEEKELEAQIGAEEVYRDSFYNREVINIAADYIEGLRKQNLAIAR